MFSTSSPTSTVVSSSSGSFLSRNHQNHPLHQLHQSSSPSLRRTLIRRSSCTTVAETTLSSKAPLQLHQQQTSHFEPLGPNCTQSAPGNHRLKRYSRHLTRQRHLQTDSSTSSSSSISSSTSTPSTCPLLSSSSTTTPESSTEFLFPSGPLKNDLSPLTTTIKSRQAVKRPALQSLSLEHKSTQSKVPFQASNSLNSGYISNDSERPSDFFEAKRLNLNRTSLASNKRVKKVSAATPPTTDTSVTASGKASAGESPSTTAAKMRGNNLRSARPANSMDQDSFDSYDDMEDMLVMSANSSLNISGQSRRTATSSGSGSDGTSPPGVGPPGGGGGLHPADQEEELPKSVVVTNVDLSVFDDPLTKTSFETMFREYDCGASFHYLRCIRRIRVDFESHLTASVAKQKLDNTLVANNVIHCYFIQVLSPCTDEEAYLHVPPLEKQFLISPPCSPPIGWEQPREDKPVVDYDLLAAMAQLSPGENHELQPSKEVTLLGKSISTPSIVVHICEEQAAQNVNPGLNSKAGGRGRIRQTPCPIRQQSLE